MLLYMLDFGQSLEKKTIDEDIKYLENTLTQACDLIMPKVKSIRNKKATYWWNNNIATLRTTCISARRKYTKIKSRPHASDGAVLECKAQFKSARRALRDAIRQAKRQAWQELINNIEDDPWGRPYLVVMNRLRSAAPALTQSLSAVILKDTLDILFLGGEGEKKSI